MRVILYVDGFNLYHLRLKPQPHHKWLNLRALAERLAPQPDTIVGVNFYTARVSKLIDPGAPARQQTYFDALATEPLVKIVFGKFLIKHDKWAKLVSPPDARPRGYVWNMPPPDLVKVVKVEEKGSDVNLGSHLVRDAMIGEFDKALVLSNDTDLVEPIRIAADVGKRVIVVAPNRARKSGRPIPSPSLRKVASGVQYLDDADLAAAQFPDPLNRPGQAKAIRKPAPWSRPSGR